jgi:L-threonine kinase
MVGPEPPADETVLVALPGTCGELVQGTLDGEPCLISCPIGWYSTAAVRFQSGGGWGLPAHTPKTRAALHRGLAYLNRAETHGNVHLHTGLPRGRGYGSSTADIGATLHALGHAAGQRLTITEVANLAVQVEPSDSSLFPDLALWAHCSGHVYEDLGAPPPCTVVVLDPGGEVDTLAFNRLDHRQALRHLAPQHRDAFALLREGLRHGNLEAIGTAATLSATAHQAILANPLLPPTLALAHEVQAVGVCRAHSGTLLGLLLDPRHADVARITALAAQRLAPAVTVFSLPLVSGGPRFLTGNPQDGTAPPQAQTQLHTSCDLAPGLSGGRRHGAPEGCTRISN